MNDHLDGYRHGYEVGYEAGRDGGLTRAREAVAEVWQCPDPMNCTVDEPVCGNRREILAAIDALRPKEKRGH